MHQRIRMTARLILIGGAASCGATEPIAPEVDLVVQQEERIDFEVDPEGDVVSLSLAFAIHNRSRGAVEYAHCLMTLEREVGGEWIRAWAPACSLLFASTSVEPGRTMVDELTIRERRRPGGLMEEWVAPFDGWYRVVAMIEQPGTVRAYTVASARFHLAPE